MFKYLVIILFLVVSETFQYGFAPSLIFAAEPKTNVIVILADDLGWADLSCYGNPFHETPHLDQMAKEGVRFTNAYSACTVCSPTRAALLSGQYPARLRVTDWIPGHIPANAKLNSPDWIKQLPLNTNTIAEYFSKQGYFCASVGKWHLGNEDSYPEKHGFLVNIAGTNKGQPPSYFSPYNIATLPDGPKGEYITDRLTDEVIKLIDQNVAKPFFIYLPHFAVHTPLQAKEQLVAKYKAKAGLKTSPVYAAMLESLDESVGRIRNHLKSKKLDQNTTVIFTSDNGGLSDLFNNGTRRPGPTSNLPLRLGKGSPYEGGTRVPFIVCSSKISKAGKISKVPVMSIDILPTVLEIGLGQKPEGISDGKSIVPALQGAETLGRDELFWHYPHYHPGGATPYSAVRQNNWKLIHTYEKNKFELYNLETDPYETQDVSGSETTLVKTLSARLDAWRKDVAAQPPVPNPKYNPSIPEDGTKKDQKKQGK